MIEENNDNIKIGLEIHFQVKGRKLFCSCKGEESENYLGKIHRKLKVTAGEMSSKDEAAMQESLKKKEFEYLVTDNSCLVEMDEEPPHTPSSEAVENAFIVARMLNAVPVDNLIFMRKIVIDGSNTSGFQRTGVVGLNGSFKFNNRKIGIASITLEEEACKKIEEKGNMVIYTLDRLGIPLIEVSTDPDINTPREAMKVAEGIGMLVKQSRMIRREASSIRQDLNISIKNGNRVEIKGVQSLSQIEEVLNGEIKRQRTLYEIAEKLKKSGLKTQRIQKLDLTSSVEKIKSEIIKKALESNKKVIGIRLLGLAGFLKNGDYRLGSEIAGRLKAIGIGGIIHSDELPNYGFTGEDKEFLFNTLNCNEGDAFALILVKDFEIEMAISVIERRIKEAFDGVPAETRAAVQNGTRYMRPLSGGARMYPETDIPPFEVTEDFLSKIGKRMPPTVEERVEHLVSLGVSTQEALSSITKEYDDVLEEYISRYRNPRTVAKLLSTVFSHQERNISRAESILNLLQKNAITKDVVSELYESDRDLSDLERNSDESESYAEKIREIVFKNRVLIKEKGEDSFKLLMGEAMKIFRGKVDGKIVSEFLMNEIRRTITDTNKQ